MRIALLLALLFALLGLHFVPQAGLHMDAALELACGYPCSPQVYSDELPLMAMSYLGALKAWLYRPLLALSGEMPSLWLLRIPFVLIGAGTIVLFFRMLDETLGRRIAVSGALLLAVDASFVLATTYDFGPVALLHLLLVAGMVLLVRFQRTGSLVALCAAFFCFGLGLWHKALFVWMLSGIGIAAVCVFPKQIREAFTWRRLGLATLSIAIGALPLIAYNIDSGGGTLQLAGVPGEAAPLEHKLHILRRTLDGTIFFGFLTEEAYPDTWKSGGPAVPFRLQSNGMPLALAVALVPALWKFPKGAAFALITMVVAWVQMALVGKTGASLHHVILLWPFPQMIVGMALSRISRRGAATAFLLIPVCSNLWLLYQYSADLRIRGTRPVWTEAVRPLAMRLREIPASHVYATDWGYSSTLCLLSGGTMAVTDLAGALRSPLPGDMARIRAAFTNPEALFVEHPEEAEQIPGIQRRLTTLAMQTGYKREIVESIADRNGRERFLISRFVPGREVIRTQLRMGDPAQERFLDGFHEIEEGSWRWTAKSFAATFQPTAEASLLRVELYVPDAVVERLGPVTLRAHTGDQNSIGSMVLKEPGEYTFTARIQQSSSDGPLTVYFDLDKALAPTPPDTRELGIIVRSLELTAP